MTMKTQKLSLPGSILLNILDVCDILQISQKTVWVWVATGKLPEPVRLAKRKVRWRRADIEALIAGKAG